MNVAALLQDSPSDDSHRRRQQPPPSNSSSGPQEHGERGAGGGTGSGGGGERSDRSDRAERGGGGNWGSYDRTRVQSQNQSTWPPPYQSRPGHTSPSTPISTDTSPYAHPKDSSWTQSAGNPYPPSAPQPPAPATYDPAPSVPSSRMRSGSNAGAHLPPTTGPGVPPPPPPGSSYMPPPEYGHQPPSHLHKHPPPPPGASTPLFPTPVPVAGQTRIPMSHSPPIGGSSYTPGPPPSTPRRPQSQLATPQPPHAHSSPSTHPSPAMASLQNPALGNSPWGPGVSGPGIVDARESQLRDRNPPALTSERDRERAADRDREMSLSLRDRERELDYQRDRARGKPPPAGPGVPPPLAGPGTGAPPPVGPGVPPMLGPGIPEDPHKISSSSAPGSSGPSRAHSRSQLAKDELMDHSREMDRGLRMPERDMPPTGPARTHDYPPPREQLSYPRDADIHGTPSSRRDREEYIGPGGPSGSSRLPPPPGSYRTSGEFGREPPPPQDYRREHPDYRRPVDYPREPPHPQRDYRREPPPGDYRREPPPPAEYRRDGLPTDYRRDGPPAEYRDYRREPPPPVDYRREPPSADYRRDPPPPDYRGAPDYRDSRRDLPPPPGPGHSPEAYRREVPEYRRDRDPQDHPSSRRNSNEHRRERDRERERAMYEREMREREREADLRRGDPGAGPGIPPGERQPRRSPHQTRDMDRDPYTRRHEDYRREPPPGPPPHDYRGGPPPPHPPEGYRSDYRGPPGDYRPPPPPPDYPPRRDHAPPPQDYRRDEYPRQPSHSHPSSAPPPPIHPGQDIRPPPGPPGDYRGPPGPDYRRDVPPGPPPPQDYRRDAPPPGDYRGPPGSLPPQNDYPRQGPPPPHSQDYRGREPGEIPPGPGGRDYPRRERDREHLRDSGDYSRGPPGAEYPPRRRDDSGEYLGRPPPPGSIPPGPGVPGRTVTPNSDPYAVKHPSERERERDKDRERWEREQRERERDRERVHYPPGSQQPSGPPPPGNAPPSHSHSHPKSHSHPHHHHGHHHHVIHSHPHQGPSSSGPPPPGGGSGSQGGPPSGQGGAPPPPSQRQLQSQFPTRFVSHTTHPGSRMGSPVPGGPPGSGGVIGPGGSSSSRKDMSGNISTGKDKKIMSSRGGPSGGPVPGSGSGRRERDEREKDRDREREREMFPPQPPHQPVPHRGEQGRVLGHGYPPLPHGAHPHGPHGQPYDDYMVVDGMDPQQQQQQQQAQLEQQQMQMQGQHPHHPHPHAHGHPHGHPMQMLPQPPPVLPHHTHPLAPQVGYYPGSQEGAPGVEDLWPMQEQPDREVKARFKINLGTFVYPNTPFPYHFDVGEWIGVNGALAKDGEKKEDAAVKDKDEAKEKEKENGKEGEQVKKKEAEKKMDVDVEDVAGREKEAEKESETEAGEVKEMEGEKEKEKESEKMSEKEKGKEKESEKEKEKIGEAQAVEKTTSQKEEADDMLDVETQATIVIPNGYIPREKPRKPAIWGGGVIGRSISPQRRPSSSSDKDKSDSPARPKKRRIYTDDSDLFLCALHSGWLTWTASARARDRGQDLRIEVRIIRCAGAGAGSVYAVGAGAFAGKYAPAVNGVVSTNGAYRQNGNGKVPVVRKEEIIGRFIGGWGEKCFVHDTNADTGDEEENSEENDGRGLVSAGWGSGHDGSAIEVLNVEFVNKGTARSAPGLGRRNRAQRLMEYSERRAAVLGLERLAAPMRLAGRKRRRTPTGWMSEDEMTEDEQTETPGESERKEEEAQLMAVRTVVFGTGLTGDMRPGYKYQPNVLKDVLFPVPSGSTLERPPPRKRRRTTLASEDIIMDGDPAESEPPAPTPNRPVILETPKETYLLSLAHGSEYSPEGRKYDISLILEGEVEEDREDAVVLVVADKNAKAPHETPPPSPPADDEPNEAVPAPSSSDVTIAATATTKPTGDEVQEKSTRDATVFASKSPSPPRTDTQLTDSSKVDTSTTTTAKSLSTKKDSATSPPSLNENVSMADPSASKASVQKTEPPAKKARLKHPVAQVLQRRVGEDMFKFTEEGVSIADGEDGMPTEWLVQVKSWKWATRKIVRV